MLNVNESGILTQPKEKLKKQSQIKEIFKRILKNKLATAGLIVIVLYILLVIFGQLIAPYEFAKNDLKVINQPPSAEHWFGTDNFGRDIFSRVLVGTRYSLGLGAGAVVIGCGVGVILGCIAGYFGGIVEELIMRFCDVLQSIPATLMAIVVFVVLGTGYFNTILALSITRIPMNCRMIRAQFLSQRKLEYVEAAQAGNVTKFKQMFKHILPNAISPIIVATTMGIGSTITMAAGLSFINLGVQPPLPEWGAMLSAAREFVRYYPYQLLYPGLAMAIFVLALNLFGDGLRDAMDPKLKH